MLLVVMLAGMALLGTAFHLYDGFVGRAFSSVENLEEKHYMDEGLEKGRIALARFIEDEPDSKLPKAYFRRDDGSGNEKKIESIDDLMLADSGGSRWFEEYVVTPIKGKAVTVLIDLYDVLYTSSDIDMDHFESLKHTLPPAYSKDFIGEIAGADRAMITVPSDGSGLSEVAPSLEAANDGYGSNKSSMGDVNIGLYMVRVTMTDHRGDRKTTETVIARGRE